MKEKSALEVKPKTLTLELVYKDDPAKQIKGFHKIGLIYKEKIYLIGIPSELADVLPEWTFLKIPNQSPDLNENPFDGG